MLRKVNFRPGFNKQLTPSGVEAGWIGGDYARFRYGMPEKIGGWEETQTNILPGVGRKIFGPHFAVGFPFHFFCRQISHS